MYETLVKTSSRAILYITQDAREAMRVVFFCTYKTYLYAYPNTFNPCMYVDQDWKCLRG